MAKAKKMATTMTTTMIWIDLPFFLFAPIVYFLLSFYDNAVKLPLTGETVMSEGV